MAKDNRASVYFDYSSCQFVGLCPDTILDLKNRFQGVDVDKELLRMNSWLLASKGKRKGTFAFIVKWLNNATPTISSPKNEIPCSASLSLHFDEYLKDLWKNCLHILELNKS